jgi:ribosomal protein S18 acetylase RimI-like enzyme
MVTSALCAIRKATPQDAVAILECLREAFEPFRHAYTPGAFADTVLTPETIARRFKTMTILVATTLDKTITGTIAAGMTNPHEGHLRGMAVRAAWQGRGIAEQLLASAESHLRSRGCRCVSLDTTEPLARAIAFYRKNGYSPTGRVQEFYGMSLHRFTKDIAAP